MKLSDRKSGVVVSEGVFAAARRVRVFLPVLARDDSTGVDAQLAVLLNGPPSANREAEVRTILEQRISTEMFLDAVLSDAPLFRPPQVVEQEVRAAEFSGIAGDHVPPPPELYTCPFGDFEWFSPAIGAPVPECPTHGPLPND